MEPNRHQGNRPGEHLVAAEIHRRGADAVMFTGNMPQIDLLASDIKQTATITIQVKAKRLNQWHSTNAYADLRTDERADNHFWVLADIDKTPDFTPEYFIVPQWWLKNMVYDTITQGNPDNPHLSARHYGITTASVPDWKVNGMSWESFPPRKPDPPSQGGL